MRACDHHLVCVAQTRLSVRNSPLACFRRSWDCALKSCAEDEVQSTTGDVGDRHGTALSAVDSLSPSQLHVVIERAGDDCVGFNTRSTSEMDCLCVPVHHFVHEDLEAVGVVEPKSAEEAYGLCSVLFCVAEDGVETRQSSTGLLVPDEDHADGVAGDLSEVGPSGGAVDVALGRTLDTNALAADAASHTVPRT